MSGFLDDLTHAARLLAGRPGFTAVAVLSLAVGIGVNTTVFSVADAVYLRPMPVSEPGRMVLLDALAENGRQEGFSYEGFEQLATASASSMEVTAFSQRGTMLKRNGESELLLVNVVAPNYFDVMRLQAEAGRTLRPELNGALDGRAEVVVSHSLWQRRFGGDGGLVGRTIQLNDALVTVVGVLPASFAGLEPGAITDLWMSPAAWIAATGARGDFVNRATKQFECLGRLKDGASVEQARAQVESMGQRLAGEWPSNHDDRWRAELASARQRREALKPVGLMLAIAVLVLWIACGNVAGLLFALSEARRREIGIRQALGATRGRLIRQLMTEALVLAGLGAAGGLLLACWLVGLLPALVPPAQVMVDYGLRMDARVLVFATAATLATVFLFGLAPALRASKSDLVPALKGGDSGAGRRMWVRSVVVTAQVALAVLLLNTAGLLWRSFLHTRSEAPGFELGRNLSVLHLYLGREAEKSDVNATFERMREEAAALPGVKRASYARRLPLMGSGGGAMYKVEFPGLQLPEAQQRASLRYDEVGPGYFDMVGTRLLSGRLFERGDTEKTDAVVVVSEALARKYFPGGSAVDRVLRVAGKDRRIVGVVDNARMNSIHEDPQPFLYFPFAQMPSSESVLLVESGGDPAAMLQPMKGAVLKLVPGAMVLQTFTMRDHLRDAMFADWAQAVLSGAVAVLGMLLSAAGLFAAVSYAAGRRTKEFGLRLAIGAQREDVFAMVLGQALRVAAAGVAVGVVAALAVSGLLRGYLYGVGPTDLWTLAASVTAAVVVAAVASLGPARRAVQIDPMVALRYE